MNTFDQVSGTVNQIHDSGVSYQYLTGQPDAINEVLQIKEQVDHPDHYNNGEIECIDAIKAAVSGKNGFEGFLVGQVIKYLWRYNYKNGLVDVKKAKWYMDYMENSMSEEQKGDRNEITAK